MTSDTLRCDTCSWHSAQLRPAADLGHQAEMILREERADHQTREEPTIIRGKSRPTTEGRTDHQTREEPTIKRGKSRPTTEGRADHQTREEPTIKRGKSRASNEGRIERRTGNNPVSNEGRAERRTREEPSVERGKSRPSKESGVDSHRVIETAVHNAATSRATDHRKHTRGCKKVKKTWETSCNIHASCVCRHGSPPSQGLKKDCRHVNIMTVIVLDLTPPCLSEKSKN